jgi:hypothetical protein
MIKVCVPLNCSRQRTAYKASRTGDIAIHTKTSQMREMNSYEKEIKKRIDEETNNRYGLTIKLYTRGANLSLQHTIEKKRNAG